MSHEATETFARHLYDLMQRIKEEASQAEARCLRHSDRQSVAAQRSDAYSVGLDRAADMVQELINAEVHKAETI